MEICPGCGAFYNKDCQYCSYVSSSWDEAATVKFTTLKINGNMNTVRIKYGEPKNDVIIVDGNMQNLKIKAKVLNVVVQGNMNDVRINRKVAYASIVHGNMNEIK